MAPGGPIPSPAVADGNGRDHGRTRERTFENPPPAHALPRRALEPAAGVDAEQLKALRRFHLGDTQAGNALEGVAGCVPALLGRYRDLTTLRFDYPLLLHGAMPLPDDKHPDQIATPFADLLRLAVSSFGQHTAGGRILSDNLARLETIVQELLAGLSAPAPAPPLLAQAVERMQDELVLDPGNRARLATAIDQLRALLPPEAALLSYSRHAGTHLLLHAMRHRLIPRHERFLETLQGLTQRLRDLLRLERAKGEDHRRAHQEGGELNSPSARFLDADALSRVVAKGRRGSKSMPAASRGRIEEALRVVEAYLAKDEVRLVTVVHSGLLLSDIRNGGLPSILHTTPERRYRLQVQASPTPCIEAEALFDEQAAQFARVIGAARTAQLELDGLYELESYEPWLDARSWRDLTPEELPLLPAVVALISADLAVGGGMRAISRLLRSGRPVQLLVEGAPGLNSGAFPEQETLTESRLEIGYLGVCHRQAWVQQSACARSQHLIAGYLTALDEACPGLHILSAEGTAPVATSPSIHPWLLAGTAIEARQHPLFHFHPSESGAAGDLYGIGHLDLQGNPQPESDWPVHQLAYVDRDGTQQSLTLKFTFADFALLHSELHQYFRLVPEGIDSEALAPVAACLSQQRKLNRQALPFIWVVDGHGKLRQALIARVLLRAAEDRQNYWRTLQAFAGVRNPYVEKVQQQMRADALEQLTAQRVQMEQAHRAELDRVRKEAARETMKRLAERLLGLDFTAADGVSRMSLTMPPSSPRAPAPAVTNPSVVASVPEDEASRVDESIEEPWIDTPLCTSCNDCLNINPQLFLYDDNKQARINDPRAGTYAQLVEAAEQCPARCIHPGLPLNADEPDADTLISRAVPFN